MAVADELHFGRAAVRLQMTQPPLSRQIQKLERVVGAQLLARDNRKVELTPAGTAFLAEARRLLGLADRAREQARRMEAGSVGTVRIGFTATAVFGVLTRLLDHLDSSLPGIHLDLREMVTRRQLATLLTGELDLGLARPPFDSAAFDSRLLQREELLVAVPASHRLAVQSHAVHPREVVGEPVIMYSPVEARYFHDLVVRLIPVPEELVVHTVSQILTMLWLVAAGRGIAFVPASATRLGVPDVRFRPIADVPPEPVHLHLLWHREARDPAVRAVLTSLRHVRL